MVLPQRSTPSRRMKVPRLVGVVEGGDLMIMVLVWVETLDNLIIFCPLISHVPRDCTYCIVGALLGF